MVQKSHLSARVLDEQEVVGKQGQNYWGLSELQETLTFLPLLSVPGDLIVVAGILLDDRTFYAL